MKLKSSLKTQLVFLLVISILIPISIISLFSYNSTKKSYSKMFDQTMNASLDRVSDIINNIYAVNTENINMLSNDPNAKNMLTGADSSAPWLLKTFEAFVASHKDIPSVYEGLTNGKMYLAPSTIKLPSDYDPRIRPWYTAAINKDGEAIVSEPYEDASAKGTMVVTFAKTVKDMNTNQTIGVVGLDIKLDVLSATVNKISIGQNGFVTVLDTSGKIIAHKNPDLINKSSKDEPWIETVLNSSSDKLELKLDKEKFEAFKMKNENTGWIIVGFVPQKELLSQINASRNITIIISIVCLLFAAAFGLIFSQRIVSSINKLVKILTKIKDGDFTEKIDIPKNATSEIVAIADAVNNMVDGTISIISRVLESTQEVKESCSDLVTICKESSLVGEEVAKAVQQIAIGATDQASKIEDGLNVTNRLNEEIENSINESEIMINASKDVVKSTEEGIVTLNLLNEIFADTSKANLQLESQIQILADKSNKIGAITDTIKAITEQTNLLALNASIEAARAGEAGKGFAVVADEVRKLAEQSARSASEINILLTEIKQSVSDVYEKINYVTRLNEKTKGNVETTNESFKNIEKAIKLLDESMGNVSKSLDQIESSKAAMIDMFSEIASVSQETAATTEEVSASSEEQASGLQEVLASTEKLSSLAVDLENVVNRFKIK